MKQKKNLMILLLIAIIGIVGVTIAYFSSTTTFENVFETPEYGTTYIEKFVSPDNWKPGDVTEKTLEVRNSGTVDEAVRVKVEESWISQNGTTLLLKQGDNVAADIHWINDDDWTKVTVDGEDYYYYYYNYKLAPGETTSKLLDKVTFNPLINASTTCSDTVVDGVLRRTCNSSGAGYDGATYKLKFTIETVQYNKYAEAWVTGNTITLLDEKPKTAVEYLVTTAVNEVNAEYNDQTKGRMFQFTHTVNDNVINESRYIGNEPYNYVYFNCDDPVENQEYNYAISCEVWRILGVFDVERTVDDPENAGQNITITETRMKLVRGTDLATTRMWDNRFSEEVSSPYGKNDWNESLMQKFLTGDYYNRTGEAADNGLKLSARKIIDDAIFYLGGFAFDDSFSTEQIYVYERGTERYNESRPISWEGKVALMYPSDMYMTYAKTEGIECYQRPFRQMGYGGLYKSKKSWIYNTNVLEGDTGYKTTWFLNPDSTTSNFVFRADYDRLSKRYGKDSFGVRPVVYLSANVKIVGGTGEEFNPYKLQKME